MKLLSLKLLHYRRFRQEEIVFKDDFSLIFWKNGSGKSSILDAIWYALFGPGSADFVRVNRDYLRSYFLTDREPSKIELTFQYGLWSYKIVRIIDAGTKKFASDFITENKDTLFWPENLEIIGWNEITNYIAELLWVSRDTFLRSVFTKQKDLEVLSGPTSERKKLINTVLGLDKIENIIEEFKREEKDKKTTLEIYKKRISEFDLESLKTQKEEKKSSLKILTQKLSSEQKLLKNIQKTFSQSKIDFENEDKKRQKFLQISNEIQTLTKLSESLETQNWNIKEELEKISKKQVFLEENKDILEKEKTSKELVQTWEKNKILFSQLKNYKENFQKSTQELENLNKKLTELFNVLEKSSFEIPPPPGTPFTKGRDFENIRLLNEEIKKLQTKKEEGLSKKIELDNKISYLRKEYEELKKEFESVKNLENKADCPTCKRPLEEYFPNLLKLYEEKLLSKATEWKALKETQLKDIENSLEKITKELEEKKNLEENLKQKEREFIRLLESKSNLEKNLEEIDKKLKEIWNISFDEVEFEKQKNHYEQIKVLYLEYVKLEWEVRNKWILEENLAKNSLQISKNSTTLENHKKELKTLEFSEENYIKIKEIYFTINSQINEKNTLIQEITKEKLHLEFDLKSLEKLENDFADDKKQIDVFVEEINNLGIKRQIMSDYILYLLDYLKPRIEDLASEYFALITDYKYTSISLDSDYNILIDGKNLDLYSGWERDLANLCLRLSLWQNLTSLKWNPINFLVLDEVLASQDKERQQNILINLKKLENKFSQIILISHLEEIKDLATNLMEIKAINREESRVNYY